MIIEWLKAVVNKILSSVLAVMPVSPFSQAIEDMEEIPAIKYINWLIPVGKMIDVALIRPL